MCDAIILAGGGNTRIGKNKSLLSIENVPVIQRIVEAVETLVDRVILVLKRDNDNMKILNLLDGRVRFVFENYAFMNPLAGMYIGLTHSTSEYSIVLPCDTPFIHKGIIKHMLNICDGFDLTIPRWDNEYLEPLCAVYRKKSVLKAIEKVEDLKDEKIRNIFNKLSKIKYVPIEDLRKFDRGLLTFFNINSLDDYKRALLINKEFNKEGSQH